MNSFRTWLFWKSLGTYVLLSGIALGGLLLALQQRSQSIPNTAESSVGELADTERQVPTVESNFQSVWSAAIIAWILGILCAAFVLSAWISPLKSLLDVLSQSGEPGDEAFNELTDHADELSQIGRLIGEREGSLRAELKATQDSDNQVTTSQSQLSAMLQSMTGGVMAIMEDERILFANSASCMLLEIDEQTAESRLFSEAVRNRHLQDAVRQALQKRQPNSVEIKVARNDTNIAACATPIASGGAVLVLNDITEVRRLESMRRDFVSGVSHELKTPLTVIQACTETLLDGAIDDKDAATRFLQQIEEQSERLSQLIVGMIQLARLESGQHVFNEEPVDLRKVVDQVIGTMKPVANGKQISLAAEGQKELFVLGDDQAIRTVAGNLVDNALKYSPEGGTVTVTVLAEDDANSLRVTDTGIGIPSTDQDRIFERFYRVKRDRNSERPGTGMGLAIVKHLCQAMSADVSLRSEDGKGSTVTVQFPIRD